MPRSPYVKRSILSTVFSKVVIFFKWGAGRILKQKSTFDYLGALEHVGRPSEVIFPKELITQGAPLVAKGVLNYYTLQYCRDWVLPFWARRQMDPGSRSFMPRAFSVLMVNLTHRNWTAVGPLDTDVEAVIDPRGLLTPTYDGWSVDVWVEADGKLHIPSCMEDIAQTAEANIPIIHTPFAVGRFLVDLECFGARHDGIDVVVQQVKVKYTGDGKKEVAVHISVRPFNPEGVSLVRSVEYGPRDQCFVVNGSPALFFSEPPDRVDCSDLHSGDVSLMLDRTAPQNRATCRAGMATAVATFRASLVPGEEKVIPFACPMRPAKRKRRARRSFKGFDAKTSRDEVEMDWRERLSQGIRLQVPEERFQNCCETNLAYMHLFDDGDHICPGPLTYHHYWFRDSAYSVTALDRMGYTDQARAKLLGYPGRQRRDGYFLSQDGEWDANGQAIWTMVEHYRLTGDEDFLSQVYPSIKAGIGWIEKRRMIHLDREDLRCGLLPAGFSAEHFGPNDFYYWDNFWALAGVRDAAEAARALGHEGEAEGFDALYRAYLEDVERAIRRDAERLGRQAVPAAPGRRYDSGMIGIVAAGYPLRLFDPRDERLLDTIRCLRDVSFFEDGFFQHMFHTGVNIYLTCQIAQCMLKAGDADAWRMIDYVLDLASPTDTWPEAVHPITRGGCMGDGHHGWAAADWLLLARNLLFVEADDHLTVTPIARDTWYEPGATIAVEKAPTYRGTVAFEITVQGDEITFSHTCTLTSAKRIEWHLPFDVVVAEGEGAVAEGKRVFFDAGLKQVKVQRA